MAHIRSLVSLFTILSVVAAQSPSSPTSEAPVVISDFNDITPSPNISWVPCFNNFTCTRLEVPLDYDDPSQGTSALAFIRIAAVTQPAPNIIINPGGPGGSGVGLILGFVSILVSVLGTSYNIISFDPRGVNNTTPTIDCFPGSPNTRATFRSDYSREVSDASSISTASKFFAADAYGRWCSNIFGGPNGTARFSSTPAVARDMLTYIEAEQRALSLPEADAKLWYYGISYGTALGMTFASMFPDRVGRMVLDGVADGEDYYNLGWKSNLFDADKIVEQFFKDCFNAGRGRCSFWGPSVKNIQTRFDRVLSTLKDRPVPVWKAPVMPQLATYSDLKGILLLALYTPITQFPVIADIFHGLENGNGTLLTIAAQAVLADPGSDDSGAVIPCVDGWGKSKVTTLDAWRDHANFLMRQSKYVGDAWGSNPLTCVSMNVPPPQSGVFRGSLPPSADNTSFPLLFLSNLLDPVTPIRSARRMSSFFPGSVLIAQNGSGHSTVFTPSTCTIQHVRAYFNGTVPPSNITCKVDITPFTHLPGQ